MDTSGMALKQPSQMTSKQSQAISMDVEHLDRLREITRAIHAGAAFTCISVDVEMWERDHSKILEVGLCGWEFLGFGGSRLTCHHLIVADNLHLENGLHCPDHRDKFRPEFGRSETVSGDELSTRMSQLVQQLNVASTPVIWVGHSIHGDLKWLREQGIETAAGSEQQCDIGRAWRALRHAGSYHDMVGMEQMMKEMGLEATWLHNGGNDAVYNIMALLKMGCEVESEMMECQSM